MSAVVTADDPQTLVSTHWLAGQKDNPDLRILDASWHMPNSGRDPQAEFAAAHIPTAQFFDIDATSDPSSDLPHMAPAPAQFAAQLGAMGIGQAHQVVVYDTVGIFSAARVWWLLRLMGLNYVAVLDGGLPKWQADGYPVSDAVKEFAAQTVVPNFQPDLIRDAAQVLQATKQGDHSIVDARALPRFRGEVDEPRPGLRAGHIPGSVCLPFGTLLQNDSTMKPSEELRAAFIDAGVDLAKPVITTCGSGVTAAILSLALTRIGKTDYSLYDGSWSEWGLNADLPIATGAE